MTTREPMRWQAFIAYADVDREWARCLAENLYRIGLNIFYDGWELIPGDVFVTKIDEGLAGSRTGLLVVSPRSLAYPWVDELYAAILTATVRRKGRLIPILLGEARLPPMLATRHAIDFTGLSGDRYEQRVRELANAILAHRPHRPHRGQPIQAPPPADGISVADNEASKIRLLASLRELRAAVVTSSQPQAEDSDIQSHLAQEAFVQSFGAVGRLYGVPGMAKKLTRGLLRKEQRARSARETQRRSESARDAAASLDNVLKKHGTAFPYLDIKAWRARARRIKSYQRAETIYRHLVQLLDEIEEHLSPN